nr:hypothetical protein BGP89_12045 [Luteimonas sp. JM171]
MGEATFFVGFEKKDLANPWRRLLQVLIKLMNGGRLLSEQHEQGILEPDFEINFPAGCPLDLLD